MLQSSQNDVALVARVILSQEPVLLKVTIELKAAFGYACGMRSDRTMGSKPFVDDLARSVKSSIRIKLEDPSVNRANQSLSRLGRDGSTRNKALIRLEHRGLSQGPRVIAPRVRHFL